MPPIDATAEQLRSLREFIHFRNSSGLKFRRHFADTGAMLVVLVLLLATAQAFLFAGASLWLIVAVLRYQKDPSPERGPVLKYLFSLPGFASPLRRRILQTGGGEHQWRSSFHSLRDSFARARGGAPLIGQDPAGSAH